MRIGAEVYLWGNKILGIYRISPLILMNYRNLQTGFYQIGKKSISLQMSRQLDNC